MMTISEMEDYLSKNKHVKTEQLQVQIFNSVGNRTMKTDSGSKRKFK